MCFSCLLNGCTGLQLLLYNPNHIRELVSWMLSLLLPGFKIHKFMLFPILNDPFQWKQKVQKSIEIGSLVTRGPTCGNQHCGLECLWKTLWRDFTKTTSSSAICNTSGTAASFRYILCNNDRFAVKGRHCKCMNWPVLLQWQRHRIPLNARSQCIRFTIGTVGTLYMNMEERMKCKVKLTAAKCSRIMLQLALQLIQWDSYVEKTNYSSYNPMHKKGLWIPQFTIESHDMIITFTCRLQ